MSDQEKTDSESQNETTFDFYFFENNDLLFNENKNVNDSQSSDSKEVEEKLNQLNEEENDNLHYSMDTIDLSKKGLIQIEKKSQEEKEGTDAKCTLDVPLRKETDCNTSSTMIDATYTSEYPFDPRTQPLSEEELKPQTPKKRSRKKSVPDCSKTERYWSRRKKNNRAAKESRISRRLKENQIILRTSFLEQENTVLNVENEKLKKENELLKEKLLSLIDSN